MSALTKAAFRARHQPALFCDKQKSAAALLPSTTVSATNDVMSLSMPEASKPIRMMPSNDLPVMAELSGGIRLRPGWGHSLCPGNGPEGRACVGGGDTIVRSRNPSADHTRKNNGSHASFA